MMSSNYSLSPLPASPEPDLEPELLALPSSSSQSNASILSKVSAISADIPKTRVMHTSLQQDFLDVQN
jgi:hypothetical protein